MMRELLSAFFPSWEFFDVVGSRLSLEVRAPQGAWAAVIPPMKRSILSCLYNPEGNLLHASHSLVQRLASQLDHASIAELEDYKLVTNLVRANHPAPFQFRLTVDGEEALVSPVIT